MKRKFIDFDISIGVAGLVLSALGLLFIYDASSYSAQVQLGDEFHYVKTQAVALFLGLILMFAFVVLDIGKLKKSTFYVYLVSLMLLGLGLYLNSPRLPTVAGPVTVPLVARTTFVTLIVFVA